MKTLFLICAVMLAGCGDDFSPNGEYKQRLIVYGVMDGNSTTQMIRVYSTFSPDLYDPLKPMPNTEVTNASVVLKEGNTSLIFHDTLIVIPSASGSRSVRAYVRYGFQPMEGKNYSLSVFAPGYDTAKSSFKGLFPGDILANSTLLSKPGPEKFIPIRVSMGDNALAYLPLILLEYRVGSDTTLHLKEIPMSILKDENGAVIKRIYPGLVYRGPALISPSVYETVTYETSAYLSTITEIKNEFGASNVKFVRAIISLKQFDSNLYTYYSITNAFGGSSTLRLDEPDYSNIKNGFGTFGMMTQQDRTYGLPSDF